MVLVQALCSWLSFLPPPPLPPARVWTYLYTLYLWIFLFTFRSLFANSNHKKKIEKTINKVNVNKWKIIFFKNFLCSEYFMYLYHRCTSFTISYKY